MLVSLALVSSLALVAAIRVPVWDTEYSNELLHQRFRNKPPLPTAIPNRLVGESATEILWINAKKPQTQRKKRRPAKPAPFRTTILADDISDTSNSYRTVLLHPTAYNHLATTTESYSNYDWIPIVPLQYQDLSNQPYHPTKPDSHFISTNQYNQKQPFFNLTGFQSLNQPKIIKPKNRYQQNKTATPIVDGLKEYLKHRNALPFYAVSTDKPTTGHLNEKEYFTSYHEHPKPSVHEAPQYIPTKPVYPGEGIWAKPGQKHRPHVTQHQYSVDEDDEEEVRPDGHEIYERNRDKFEGKFGDKIRTTSRDNGRLQKVNRQEEINNQTAETNDPKEDYEESEDRSFVPTKTYIQTRHSESVQNHLPPVEDRLKEVIKDTEIHTVYTEEGYEDEAYDHAKQHTKAEDMERDRTKSKPRSRRRPNQKDREILANFSDQPDPAFLVAKSPRSLNKPEKEITRRTAKTTENEEIEMEITSVVKNNGSKTQKIVKIVPVERGYGRYRRKRSAILFPENTRKYPYYNVPTSKLNEFSPLRYAENLSNIPKKEQGNMALYDKFKESECAEIPNNINPVPEQLDSFHTKSESTETAKNASPSGPRLKKLGDKIDCLKSKLFGENPLDSPLFGEKNIELPSPIFREIENLKQIPLERGSRKVNPIKHILLKSNGTIPTAQNQSTHNPATKVYSARYVNEGITSSSANTFNKSNKDLLTRPSTFFKDANNTVPESSPLRIRLSKRKRVQRPKPYNNYSYTTKRQVSPVTSRTPGLPFDFFQTRVTVLPKYKTISEVHYKDEIKPNEQLNVFADVINNIKNNSVDSQLVSSDKELAFSIVHPPYTERNAAISVIRPPTFSRKRPKYSSRKSHIKDRTHIPINENEQTDILTSSTNHKSKLENGSFRKTNQVPKKEEDYEEIFSTFKRDYGNKVKETNPEVADEPSTPRPFQNHNSVYAEEETETTTKNLYDDSVDLTPPIPPPFPFPYKMPTVKKLMPHNFPFAAQNSMNRFIVFGMRPPPSSKPLSYSDYALVSHNRIQSNKFHHITKRNAFKPIYSEIRRSSGQSQNNQNEEEDYVPQRNRNYHYDVKNRRIVYDKKQPEIEEEEIEEMVEPEGEIEYITLTPVVSKNFQAETPATQRIVTTTQRNGPSFLDYVSLVKQDTTYQTILDPKDIKPDSTTSTTSTPTSPPGPTTPPPFLSVISQIRSDSGYKAIPEKKTTTTTPEPEEEEFDPTDVKNSPGGQQSLDSPNEPKIDEESDPSAALDVKSYSPRTSIDYSKYKTIQRGSTTRRKYSENLVEVTERVAEDRLFDETPTTKESTLTTPMSPILSSSSTTQAAPTSKQPIIRRRPANRLRLTTFRPITTTERQSPTPVSRRTVLRRRPTTTTTELSSQEASTEAVSSNRVRFRGRVRVSTPAASASIKKRWIAGRSNNTILQQIPSNHKPFYEPIKELKSYPSPKVLVIPDGKVSSTETRFVAFQRPMKFDVEMFNKYDRSLKHGGNYRRQEEDAESTTLVPPTAYSLDDSKALRRLSDVVPKPFSFYSDPALPTVVNQMLSAQSSTTERHSAEVIDLNEKSSTLKPATVIKDPRKRLYFYAAVK